MRAARTVTFAAYKPGLLFGDGPEHAGEVEVADIGLGSLVQPAASAWLVEDADVAAGWPARGRQAHKWQSAVQIVAGSPDMYGAPWLVARGALRAGAGYARVGVPGAPPGGGLPPGEQVTYRLAAEDWDNEVEALGLDRVRALVVGPGLGPAAGNHTAPGSPVRAPVGGGPGARRSSTRTDCEPSPTWPRPPPSSRAAAPPPSLTPHEGEYARLVGRPPGEDRIADVRAVAQQTGAVLLLKGSPTSGGRPRRPGPGGGGGLGPAGHRWDGRCPVRRHRRLPGSGPARPGGGGLRRPLSRPGRGARTGRGPGGVRPAGPDVPVVVGGRRLITAEVATGQLRPAWAEVDLGAIRHNAAVLAGVVAPARLCAVVKAGGYGHGAAAVARAALEGGASWLAVALVEEGLELRAAGITAPVLLLVSPTRGHARGGGRPLDPDGVHGGGSGGVAPGGGGRARPPAGASQPAFPCTSRWTPGCTGWERTRGAAVALAVAVDRDPALRLEGFWTHFAVADALDDPYTTEQLARFDAAVAALAERGIRPPLLHAANSAGAMWHPASRYGLVRCGIALYGLAPCARGLDRPPAARPASGAFPQGPGGPRPGASAGDRVSYGLRYQLAQDSVVATVPLGYADGVTRALSATGGEVLLDGGRRPIAGTVTMDQILVDCGPGSSVAVGDEVVLLGSQGGEHHRLGLGDAHGHHRLRGGLRHQRAGAPGLPGRLRLGRR